jgi:hypothetical protein
VLMGSCVSVMLEKREHPISTKRKGNMIVFLH